MAHQESPFAPYFDTNYAPSDREKLHLQEVIAAPQKIVAEIDRRIAELQRQHEALIVVRRAPAQYVWQHKRLLNPIRRLPVEILQTIFLFCANGAPPGSEGVMSARRIPMVLTFVCRRWRQVTLDLPPLWEKLQVFIPKPMRNQEWWKVVIQRRTELVRLWLSRASGRQITLSIVTMSHFLESENQPALADDVKTLIDLVISSSPQWKHLRVELAQPLLQPFLSIPASSTPNLQYLDLGYESDEYRDEDLGCQFGSGQHMISSPNIRDLRLYSTCQDEIVALPVQWHQLTELNINMTMEVSDCEILPVLSSCPLLEQFGVAILRFDLLSPSQKPATLPNLRRLTIEEFFDGHGGNTTASNFFLSLDLPVLSSIKFGFEENHADAVTGVIERSSTTIRTLDLNIEEISTDQVIRLLAHAFRLESLSLCIRFPEPPDSALSLRLSVPDRFLTALTPGASLTTSPTAYGHEEQVPSMGDLLCPKLQELKLRLEGFAFSTDAVFKFIKGRRDSATGLREVEIVHTCDDEAGCQYRGFELAVMDRLNESRVDVSGMSLRFPECAGVVA